MSLTSERPSLAGGVIFDLAERGFLLLLGTWTVCRLAPSITREPQISVLLMSELLAVVFILLRRSARRIDSSPYAAAVAFAGTAGPLLVVAPGQGVIPPHLGAALMIAGLLLTICAKLALNRSFGLTAANRGVKRAGPYRLLRHPMYAGYVLTQAVFLLLNPCVWNLCIYVASWSAQLLRIHAEERVLLEDPAYRDYAASVRFRLIPGLY